ncbi:unnamed protein product [Boreogadus saida]
MELPFPSSHTKPKRQIHFRNVKNINMDALALDLQHLSSGSTDSLSVADSVNLYNQSLSSLLDLQAPLTSSQLVLHGLAPFTFRTPQHRQTVTYTRQDPDVTTDPRRTTCEAVHACG